MKPAELYALPVVYEETDLYILKGMVEVFDLWCIPDAAQTRVVVKYHANFSFDGNRCWTLASVWFDGRPVMVLKRAGRSGEDFKDDCITDGPGYGAMLVYLLTLTQEYATDLKVAGPEDDISTEFYRCTYEEIMAMNVTRDQENAERRAKYAAKEGK